MNRWAALGATVIAIGVVGFAESEHKAGRLGNQQTVATESDAPWMQEMSQRLVKQSDDYLTNAWTCRATLGTNVYDKAQLDVVQTMLKLHAPLETALLYVETRDSMLKGLNLTSIENYDLCRKLVRAGSDRLRQIRMIVLEELRD